MARILVIDDDLDLLQMMKLILQRTGHEAILTGDGADGLAKAQQLKPDMAIVDVMMPGMNGYQVVRKLREDPTTTNMIILVLTARAQSVDREAAMAVHADAYMSKPVSPAELVQAINDLLNKRGQTSLPPNMVLSVLSLRGGVGTTTIAINLALALRQPGREVCLVDMCSRSGHAAMQLRLQVKTTWIDVLAQINGLSADQLDRLLLRHDSGVRLLPSPFMPPVRAPGGELVARLIGLLKPMFGVLVVDLGTLDEAGRAVATLSDLVAVVLSPDVASLQSAAAALRVLKSSNIADDKVSLILNQVTPRAGLSNAAIEKALGRSIAVSLPYEDAQGQALAQGIPLAVGQSSSPLVASLSQFIQVAPAKAWRTA
jgi:pilus assembly protein CpaE